MPLPLDGRMVFVTLTSFYLYLLLLLVLLSKVAASVLNMLSTSTAATVGEYIEQHFIVRMTSS